VQVEERFRQEKRGRPGPQTRYRRVTRPRLQLSYAVDAAAVSAEAASDGCFPLITNDRVLTPAQLLAAYKYQPNLEHRHAELKGPMDVAPVFLKDAARIEGLLCLEFLALLTRALIEREVRQAMERRHLPELSLYPEDRGCRAPTATRLLAIFSGLARHRLLDGDRVVQVFPPKFTLLQQQVLDLLGVPEHAFTA
jgi:transposase